MTTQTFNKEKYYSLDLLRAIAAMIVALAHFSLGTIEVQNIAAGLSVGLFFILSGFVLSHAYQTQIGNQSFTLKSYAILRIARLYPLHILTFLVTVIYWLFIEFGKREGFLSTGAQADWNVLSIIENLTFTHLLLQEKVSFNTPSWSISVEFWCSFYVFFLCLPIRTYIKTLVILIVTALFAIVEINGGFLNAESVRIGGFLEKNYITGLACFSLGWAIYKLEIKVNPFLSWTYTALLLLIILWQPVDLSEFPWLELVYWAGMALSIILLRSAQPKDSRLRSLMETSGNMSYGIYLWHIPLILWMHRINKMTGTPENTRGMDLIYIGILLPLAWVTYKFFERPAQRWIRKKFDKPNRDINLPVGL